MSILDRDLSECKTFNEISLWRAEKYKIDKKSGDDYTGILTNIYKEPTHFIYELLQNADDAKATNVRFVLSRDKIEFFHDGSKEFSLSDIISITGVGNSSKESKDITTIGKFGVGFKAVFAVTNKPLVYSTTYNFQIENLSVPSEIPSRNLEGFTTVFQLDFKSEDQITLFRRNETLLRSMSPETILFLKNICTVNITINDEQIPTISVSRIEAEQSFSRIQFNRDDKAVELLKFTQDGCSVVYQLSDGAVTPILGSKVSVFFPTIIDSNLPFLVDAPFQTSTTRESIDFERPYNKTIIKKFNDIFVESIDKLKTLDLFTVEVFNDVMPINTIEESQGFPLYKTLRSSFMQSVKFHKFVPTEKRGLLRARQISITNDPEVVDLLVSVPDINFAHRRLSASSVEFIREAGAKTFETVNILSLISNNHIILTEQTDEWLYQLYEYCLKSILKDGWNRIFIRTLKQTPIIRTRSGSFTAVLFNDNPHVFRPSKGIPDHRTIHPMFLTDATSVSDETKGRMKSFLSELGITERKPVIVLREDYFRDYTAKTTDEKLEVFKAVAEIYKQSEPKDKADIEVYLKHMAFIPSEVGEFKLAANLYDAYNTDLKYLLGTEHLELFCSSLISSNADYREFCLALGLISQIKIDALIDRHSNREDFIELYDLVGSSQDYGTSTKDYTRTNYDSPTLRTILSGNLSSDLASRLAPLLQKILPDQFKESFEWTYYGNKKELIGPSIVCKLLTDTAWIARDDQMLRPGEISYEEFCDLYKLPRDNVLQYLAWSNDDIIKQLSAKEQEAIKLMRELDLSPEEMHELRIATIEKRKKSERLSKRQSTNINELLEHSDAETEATQVVNLDDTIADEITPLQHTDKTLHASEDYEAADTEPAQSVITKTTARSDWSNVEQEEREVLKGLTEWYKGDGYASIDESENQATYTMQKNSKTVKLMLLPKNNSGYNIEVSEDGKIVKTIAVIKTDLNKKRFVISEAQWNLSKRADIRHSIYLVSRQGSSMRQVVIDDLRERIRDGSAKAIPGVIYYT
jgi:hypothetical protein